MPIYVMLANFTHQGIQNIKDTTKRADAFKAAAKKAGCTVKEIYWTQGQYDSVTILDAPDEASATALVRASGSSATFARRLCAPSRRLNSRRSWIRSSSSLSD